MTMLDPGDDPRMAIDDPDPAEALLAQCLELPESDRARAIERACAGRPELASELRLRVAALRAMGVELAETRGFPEQLGDFRLIEVLGGGGMGVVYLAVQTSLQRDVALKLIRPEHLFFAGARARFRREAEAVARLQHPGIVPIYAVGEEQGIPYFAMELVRGCTLAEALRPLANRAPESLRGSDLHTVVASAAKSTDPMNEGSTFDGAWVETCLRIARQVADALHHAHERGLVHRDVKPSNIALTPDGRALLLDFGLTSMDDGSDMTRSGSALGTLHYMSPEQVRGARDVDARSDVYSLGVALYEMLALQVPFRGENALEMQRLLLDAPDSIRARNRRVEADVETAVLCAIDRDPARRYSSAAEFARDLAHLLSHRPIAARRPGPLLRARRWLQRNPAKGTALVLVPALAIGAGAAILAQEKSHSKSLSIALDETRAARDKAERESARAAREAEAAEGALDFVGGMFEPVSLDRQKRDKPMTAREILDHGASTIDHGYLNQPHVRARIQAMLGAGLERFGEHARAAELLERACEWWRKDPSAAGVDFPDALYWEAVALHELGRDAEARPRLEAALGLWPESAVGARGRMSTLEALVMVPARDASEVKRDLESAVDAELAQPGMDTVREAEARARLGYSLLERKSFDDAAAALEQACGVLENEPDPDPMVVHALSNFSQARLGQGRLSEALEINGRALAIARVLHPSGGQDVGKLYLNRGGVQARIGDLDAAMLSYREAAELLSEALAPDHPIALAPIALLATAASTHGRCADAEEAACEVIMRTDGGRERDGDTSRAHAFAALARCAERRGDRATAVAHWREAAAGMRAVPAARAKRMEALSNLVRLRWSDGALAECELLLHDALALVPADSLAAADCKLLEQAAAFCAATGRDAEARSYASRMEE